jgi:hypothetical protein
MSQSYKLIDETKFKFFIFKFVHIINSYEFHALLYCFTLLVNTHCVYIRMLLIDIFSVLFKLSGNIHLIYFTTF